MSLKNSLLTILFIYTANIYSQNIQFIFEPERDMIDRSQSQKVQAMIKLADQYPESSLNIIGFYKNQASIAHDRVDTVANLALSNGIARSRICQKVMQDHAKFNTVEVSI